MVQRVMRRVRGIGWDVTSAAGGRLMIHDGGDVFHAEEELIGTSEAAAIAGVRPPNFVSDWASRVDFPAPAATTSAGRIWRASEVREYVCRRHPVKPSAERLAAIARRVAWWDPPERTQSRPRLFIARVLARGSVDDILDIEAQYGKASLRRAVQAAPADVLDGRARNYWQLVLELPRDPAPPVRRLP